MSGQYQQGYVDACLDILEDLTDLPPKPGITEATQTVERLMKEARTR